MKKHALTVAFAVLLLGACGGDSENTAEDTTYAVPLNVEIECNEVVLANERFTTSQECEEFAMQNTFTCNENEISINCDAPLASD